MDPEGRGMTQAGKIMGMISSILAIVVIGIYLLIFLFAGVAAISL